MSIIKKIFFKFFILIILSISFAHSSPVLQSPKKDREARLFVSFRPEDKVADEVSTTSGYEFNVQNSITATSGKSKFKFDLPQGNFAWISSNKTCLLYTSPSPRDLSTSRMPSSA